VTPMGSTARGAVQMRPGERGTAALAALQPGTSGSQLRLPLTDGQGRPLESGDVDWKVSNPAEPSPDRDQNDTAERRLDRRLPLPLPGVWKDTLTVQNPDHTGVVTAGNVTISN
jgi:hypothetical protein